MGSSFGPSYLKLAYFPLLPARPVLTPARELSGLVALDKPVDEEEADVIGEPILEDESRMDDSAPIDGDRKVELDATLDAEDEGDTAATGLRKGFRDCQFTVGVGGWLGPACSDRGTWNFGANDVGPWSCICE
jgi:hypothetical protein